MVASARTLLLLPVTAAAAKFDPLLVQSVARYAVASLDLMLTRLDGLVSTAKAALIWELTDHLRSQGNEQQQA